MDSDPQHWLRGIRRMKDKRKIERDITKQKTQQSYTHSQKQAGKSACYNLKMPTRIQLAADRG
jgi:hypothetical protein